jgi:GAF domain-containing protein
MLSVPIKLRDQVIGTLNIRPNTDGKTWNADEINIVQAITERLGLALDNARLFEETTRRAEREHIVSDITTKIRNTNDPQEMVKTAVEELKRALGVTRVEIIPQKVAAPPEKQIGEK